MVSVFLGLGSNIQPTYHIQQGIEALEAVFGELTISPFYECAAVGFSGPDFLNGVVSFQTELSLEEIIQQCRVIEKNHGRDPQAKKWSSRTLDIDLLLYGDCVGTFFGVQLPRADILEYAFVLWPLADIAPELKHPVIQRKYAELKQALPFEQPVICDSLS